MLGSGVQWEVREGLQALFGPRRSEGETQGRWEKAHDTARRRRGGSASILGVRAGNGDAWRGREASGETRHEERAGGATRARHAAGGLGVRRRRRHGEKQRRRWSEGKLINNSKFQNFIL